MKFRWVYRRPIGGASMREKFVPGNACLSSSNCSTRDLVEHLVFYWETPCQFPLGPDKMQQVWPVPCTNQASTHIVFSQIFCRVHVGSLANMEYSSIWKRTPGVKPGHQAVLNPPVQTLEPLSVWNWGDHHSTTFFRSFPLKVLRRWMTLHKSL